ncbi:nitrate/nitrite transporter [Spongisporangium articulatum]|uniref:Lysosomal dipeptide transporter MFSD1 n=1 Tax=Spongisporangium articulatum TaxID=3362603 RepID=A0ABW8AQM4_9ACTN
MTAAPTPALSSRWAVHSDTRGLVSAWPIWVIGLAGYAFAIFNRSSLAVAGLAAADRFHISASQLATFTMVQLVLYAGLQVPVGLMVDRFGPRAVLTTGLCLLIVGQAGFALAGSYPAALGARVLVGAGDAMTFISVLRLVNSWFAPRRVPLLLQVTGVVGQFGAIGAAIPMAWALDELGWTHAYLAATVPGLVFLAALLLVVHDEPGRRYRRGPALSATAAQRSLATSWRQPGTRLGFWVHFTTGFSPTMFALLWGYPFLVRGEGVAPSTAAALATCLVISQLVAGPALGWLMAVRPYHRSTTALVIVAAIVLAWTTVLVWPGDAPLPLLVAFALVIGIGGPASLIGMDLARTSNPAERLASATGIVNQANFTATLSVVVVIGILLDALSPGGSGAYTPEAFRWAMAAQYVLWAFGVAQIVRYRRRVRAARAAGVTAGSGSPSPVR